MKYDPDDKSLYFNTEMILSESESNACSDSFKSWQQDSIHHPAAWMNSMIKPDEDDNKVIVALYLVGGLVLFGGILASIFCVATKRYDLIPWIMAATMGIIGFVSLFFPDSRSKKVFAESKLCQRIEGAIGIIGVIALIVIRLKVPFDEPVRFTVIVLIAICAVVFLVMLIKSIGILNAPKSIYKEEVKATCIGYVRSYEAYRSDGAGSDYYPVNSPVFEYHYYGEKLQSFYDILTNGKDGTIQVGSENMIKIDPDNPSRVMGNCRRFASTPVIFAIVAFAACAALTAALFM